MDTEHPYMKQYNIINGVSTLENNFEYIIRIKNNSIDGIFGSTSNKSEAIAILERVGKDELRILRKTEDKEWTITKSEFNEDEMTYIITYQRIGRLVNGPMKIYSVVYIEEVPRLYTSEYSHNILVDGPYASIADELKCHPKTKQFNDEYKY